MLASEQEEAMALRNERAHLKKVRPWCRYWKRRVNTLALRLQNLKEHSPLNVRLQLRFWQQADGRRLSWCRTWSRELSAERDHSMQLSNKSLMPSRWLNSLRDDLKIWAKTGRNRRPRFPTRKCQNAKRPSLVR